MEIKGGGEEKIWINYPINASKPIVGEWNSIHTSFNIPDSIQSHKLVKIYAWNPGKEPVFIDDILIQFK